MPIVKGFRRFPSNIVSSRRVVTEISILVPGSNVHQSGRSSAASFTTKRPIQKKVSSADRRAMLESFVNKYRAMNVGKFPPISTAQKEVGGSYYTIRTMLQEMEYNCKISSMEKRSVKENKNQIKVDAISSETASKSSGSQEKLNSQKAIDQQPYEDAQQESVSNFDIDDESKEGFQPSTSSSADTGNSSIARDEIHHIAMESHDSRGQIHDKPDRNAHAKSPSEDNFGFEDSTLKSEQQQSHEKPEHNANAESPSENNFSLEDSKLKVEQQHDGIGNIMRERQKDDDELREKASVWGNLKSFAAGFINIWRKS